MNITDPQLYAVTSVKISALAGLLPRQVRVLEKYTDTRGDWLRASNGARELILGLNVALSWPCVAAVTCASPITASGVAL